MPTTLASLILFVLLVAPGLMYVHRRQRDMPYKDRSIFREAVDVGIAGVFFNLLTFVPLLVVAKFLPSVIFNVGALIANPRDYLADDWFQTGAWMLAALSAATGLSFIVGNRQTELHPSDTSSWKELFVTTPERYEKDYGRKYETYVSCELDDGTWVGGTVFDYNPTTKEDGNRDLILKQPINYRPRGETKDVPYEGISAVCVSANSIRTMFVTWGPKGFTSGKNTLNKENMVQIPVNYLQSMSVTWNLSPTGHSQAEEEAAADPQRAEADQLYVLGPAFRRRHDSYPSSSSQPPSPQT